MGALMVGVLPAAPASAAVPPFSDTAGHPFAADIEWLRQAGITGGCGNGRFCPDAPVRRDEMASFLGRAFELPGSATDAFADDDGSIHEADINRLAASGITGGCATNRYCPRNAVTRGQMASFLARALGLPSAVRDYFADDDRSTHQTDINRLAESGITGGCGHGRFCPAASVTRGQMAAFLHRALAGADSAAGCALFPSTNVWNRRVDTLPVASNSATMISTWSPCSATG